MKGSVRTYVAVIGLLALGAVFTRAGFWQWQRAAESRALAAQFEAGASATPLGMAPRELADEQRFRRVEIRGEYVAEPQFLLDNMLHDGAAGYHVLTALRVPGQREHVIVNRGWVRADADRSVLPAVAAPAGPRRVVGRLERLPRPGIRLGGGAAPDGAGARAVAVVQFPTAAELAAQLGEPVLDYQLLLERAEPAGFVREWRAPGVAPERNLSYAGQWWLFATGAFSAAVVVAVRSMRRMQ